MMWKTLLTFIAVTSLSLSLGCKKGQEAGEGGEFPQEVIGEPDTPENPEVNPPTQEKPPVEDVEVDESLFIKAYFEVTCVQAQVEDPDLQKRIIEEIHARYGFDNADAYKAAENKVSSKPNIKLALESRMKGCTKEVAESFEKAGATVIANPTNPENTENPEATADMGAQAQDMAQKVEEPDTKEPDMAKDVEVEKPKKSKLAYLPGSFKDNNVRDSTLKGAKIRLSLGANGKVSGTFQGSRYGKSFSFGLRGSVSKRGKLNASGGSIRISGTASKNVVSGVFKGGINGKPFSARFRARQ